jgi:hypothetical protein
MGYDRVAVDTWTFIWLMLIMKIPMVGMLLLVRWAVKQSPVEEVQSDDDGGLAVDPGAHPRLPHHPRPRRPRGPRRGPHRDAPAPASPARVRTVIARKRLTQH